jgi:hypothetical protein
MNEPSREDLEYAADYLHTDVDDGDGLRRRNVEAYLREEAKKPTFGEAAQKILGGLTPRERQALEEFQEKKKRMMQSEAQNLMDRLRIVRNSIVREWQKLKRVRSTLPLGVQSHERIAREMNGLKTALVLLYHEIEELERIPMDQKPKCPFCQEEMDLSELASHMKEHNARGDKLRGFSDDVSEKVCQQMFGPAAPGMTRVMREEMGIPSAGPPFGPGDDRVREVIGPIHLVDDSQPIEVMIEGIKYRKVEEDDTPIATKDPEDPDEMMDCVQCHLKVKLSQTVRRKLGNQLLVKWKCIGCGLDNEGVIVLGSIHSCMAGGQGGAAHPNPDSPSGNPDVVLKILTEQRELYPGRTCACCWHYERIMRDPDVEMPESCNTFLILPESSCVSWKHHAGGQGGAAHPDPDPHSEDSNE